MKMSSEGIKFLIGLEGKKNKAYKDTKGLWTIGVGHLLLNSEKEMIDKELTDLEVENLLAKDLIQFERIVNHAIHNDITQYQFDACVSLAFNVGVNGFAYSTVAKKINTGKFNEVEDAFMMWNKPKEIIGRRRKEANLFMTGKYN